MPSVSFSESRVLLRQLRWVVRLRWVAGAIVVIGSLANHLWLHWHDHAWAGAVIGAGILACNAVLFLLNRRLGRHSSRATTLVWAHILLDLCCLGILTALTGGARSALLAFFILHMVFASLLLPRAMAYGAAGAAVLIASIALAVSGQWPSELPTRLVMAGWVITLVFTVYLTNHITRALHRHRERLLRQNERIRVLVDRLQRQQKALIQHEKIVVMGQMAAGVAHEITNPLASMDSLLQLMQRNPERSQAQRLQRLRDLGERMQAMVRQLTGFAHPTEYHWKTVALNDLARMGLEVVQFDRRLSSVALLKQLSDPDCMVRVQPHAVQQALTNILFNALDAVADAPEPQMVIGTDRVNGTGRIWVRDNGPGLSPDQVGRIFEPFFTTKPVGKGTGLGLAIASSLIENQGGRVEVESEPGQGATFAICLPRP